MKRLFGGINLSWKLLIILSVFIGVSVGLLNSVPALLDTTVTDVATYFDFWIFCGIFIIMNSKSNIDSAFKCFIFFLISQPLIYLVEVPFSHMGWQLFGYYKYWFIWTILTIPMGYIGYYIKKEKWYSLIILLPMLFFFSMGVGRSLNDMLYSFPNHIINFIFIIVMLIIFALGIFKDKYLKYICLAFSIGFIIFSIVYAMFNRYSYDTSLKCSCEELYYDDTYKVYLSEKKYGDVSIEYIESIDTYCISSKFYKTGDTKLIIENPKGEKRELNLHIGKDTYELEGFE